MNRAARAAIRRLRAGIVPTWALDRLSVGYEHVRELADQSLEKTLSGKRVDPLFVCGEWGIGKTHLLSFVRASAGQLGVPCALVTLDATLFSLNHPQRLYAAIGERLVLEQYVGLRSILTHFLSDTRSRSDLIAFTDSGVPYDLAYCLRTLCEAGARGESALLDEEYAWSVPLGLDLRWADYTYKRKAALSRLAALVKMFNYLGFGGIVLLFDEAETVDQLWNIRSRLSGYATIGSICRTEGLWSIFGITDRFDRTVRGDLDRIPELSIPIDYDAEWFLSNWKRGHFRAFAPPAIDRTFAEKVVKNIARLYADAHGIEIDNAVVERVSAEWRANAARNPRRLMRATIDAIDRHRSLIAKEDLAFAL
jgi:hypothetical protein